MTQAPPARSTPRGAPGPAPHRPDRRARLDRHGYRLAVAAPRPYGGFTSHWYRLADGLRLHVRQRVPARPADTCVLVHGLAVSHRYLMPTAAALDGYAVYVPDLPGFGLSGDPARVYRVPDHAVALDGWLSTMDSGPVCLVGNSYGCQVAVELALRRPDLVRALVLVAPTADPHARGAAGLLARWLRTVPFEDPREAGIFIRDIRDAGPRRIWSTLRGCPQDRIEAKLPALAVPVLVLGGGQDRIAPPGWIARAAALAPAGRAGIVPGAGHCANTTAGTEVAARVRAFLGALPAAGRPAGDLVRRCCRSPFGDRAPG